MPIGYTTHQSGAGHRFPPSGFLLGKAAEALQLRGVLRDAEATGVSYKTAQRYFSGERVEPGAASQILDSLLDALAPEDLAAPEVLSLDGPRSIRAVLGEMLPRVVRGWDQFVARSSIWSFPVKREELPIPILRMVTLDAGIRWGAWLYLEGVEPRFETDWLERDVLRRIVDRLRASKITIPELTEKCGVSRNAMKAWRAGKSLPRNDQIEALGRVLAGTSGRRRGEVEFIVRLAVGAAGLHRELRALLGPKRVGDFISAFKTTARRTVEFLVEVEAPLGGGLRSTQGTPWASCGSARC